MITAPAPQPSRRLACARCGTAFDCGLGGECWCAAEPYRLPLTSRRRERGLPLPALLAQGSCAVRTLTLRAGGPRPALAACGRTLIMPPPPHGHRHHDPRNRADRHQARHGKRIRGRRESRRPDLQARQRLQVHDACNARTRTRRATGCLCSGTRWRTTPRISASSADFQEWRKLVGHCFAVAAGCRARHRGGAWILDREAPAVSSPPIPAACRAPPKWWSCCWPSRKSPARAAPSSTPPCARPSRCVVRKQIECGLDIINDGEQGRTDYTVHVLDRLTGFEGESSPPLGTGEPEFPELAAILKHFASPFQHRPACSGPVAWKDLAAARGRHRAAPRTRCSRRESRGIFMTSPSPGQIARYLKNRYYKTEEDYIFALADVMKREYQAIVDAGFILQLDCPDLAMLRHMVYLDLPLADYPQDHRRQRRGAQSRGARHPGRPHAHACLLGLDRGAAPHRRAAQGHRRHRAHRPSRMAVSFPGRQCAPRARVENLARRQAAGRQDHHPRRDRFHRRTSSSIRSWSPTAS